MAEEGILKEFDPLTGSTEKTTAQANRRNNSELVTSNAGPATISNSNILDVFDPLAQEKSAKRQDLGQLPSISETSLHSVTSSSQSSTNHEHPSTVNHFNLTNKLERSQLGILAPKPVKDKQPVLTGASDQMKSDQIGAEIRQIDTVLKALNMGQFDLSSLGLGPTAQSVQISKFDQAKQVCTLIIYPYPQATLSCHPVYSLVPRPYPPKEGRVWCTKFKSVDWTEDTYII